MIDPANASEPAKIAGEVGVDVFEGAPRYPSDTGDWQLGVLDLSEFLDRDRDQRVALLIAPVRKAEPATYTSGVCGFVMNELRECPRCKLAVQEEIVGAGQWGRSAGHSRSGG